MKISLTDKIESVFNLIEILLIGRFQNVGGNEEIIVDK